MKKLVMAVAMLGMLLVGGNAPAEASAVESAIGSQVEVVEVMHRSHPPQRHHDFGGDHGNHDGRHHGRRNGGCNPPPPKVGGRDWHHGDRGGHQPHFPGGRRW